MNVSLKSSLTQCILIIQCDITHQYIQLYNPQFTLVDVREILDNVQYSLMVRILNNTDYFSKIKAIDQHTCTHTCREREREHCNQSINQSINVGKLKAFELSLRIMQRCQLSSPFLNTSVKVPTKAIVFKIKQKFLD